VEDIEPAILAHILDKTNGIEDVKSLSSLHDWIHPWIVLFGQDACETLLIGIYKKLKEALTHSSWDAYDLSVRYIDYFVVDFCRFYCYFLRGRRLYMHYF
jgi:hypothetical protein